jgi:hypothetical protein
MLLYKRYKAWNRYWLVQIDCYSPAILYLLKVLNFMRLDLRYKPSAGDMIGRKVALSLGRGFILVWESFTQSFSTWHEPDH